MPPSTGRQTICKGQVPLARVRTFSVTFCLSGRQHHPFIDLYTPNLGPSNTVDLLFSSAAHSHTYMFRTKAVGLAKSQRLPQAIVDTGLDYCVTRTIELMTTFSLEYGYSFRDGI